MIDPRFPAERRSRLDDRWSDLLSCLKRAVHYQLLVCPLDEIHERESKLFQYGAATVELAKSLSGGVKFKYGFRILSQQLARSAQSWFLGRDDWETTPNRVCAFREDPNGWSPWFDIEVTGFPPLYTPEQLRTERESWNKVLAPVCDEWRSRPREFMEVMTELQASFAPAILRRAICDISDLGSDPMRAIGSEAIEHLQLVRYTLLRLRCPAEEAFLASCRFFLSEAAARTPWGRIRSVLLAHEAHLIRHGMNQPRPSVLSDVDRLSVVLPYCDAMLVENHFATALQQRRQWLPREAQRCVVFSVRQLPTFIAYVENARAKLSASHVARVRYLYGEFDLP